MGKAKSQLHVGLEQRDTHTWSSIKPTQPSTQQRVLQVALRCEAPEGDACRRHCESLPLLPPVAPELLW